MSYGIRFRLRTADEWHAVAPVGDRRGQPRKRHGSRGGREVKPQAWASEEQAERAKILMELHQPNCEFAVVPL